VPTLTGDVVLKVSTFFSTLGYIFFKVGHFVLFPWGLVVVHHFAGIKG